MNRSNLRARPRILIMLASAVVVATIAAPVVSAKPPPGGPAETNAKTTEVQILALNDFHGQLRPPDSACSQSDIRAR